MSKSSASAWRKARPFKAPPPPVAYPVVQRHAPDYMGRPVSYAAMAKGAERPAPLIDVIEAVQAAANDNGQPMDVVRVYILRGAKAAGFPSGRDYAACAERYTGLPCNSSRTHHAPRLPVNTPGSGVVWQYVMTVYPEGDVAPNNNQLEA